MTDDPTRRFTDREVALVLRVAAEIDESEGSVEGSGLSLADIREVAREVGISASSIDRAVARLDTPRGSRALSGGPLVHKAVRAIPGSLDREAVADLVRVVDEHMDSAGTISEALGSVRWTASDRMKSTLVSITPGDEETSIQVVEKAVPRMKRVFHLIPGAWGSMIAAPVIGGAGLGLAGGIGVLALGVGLGMGAGRLVWNAISAQSARRVERLAATLADAARKP